MTGTDLTPASMNQMPVVAGAAASALVAREVQSIQGMIIAAKNFPRDQGAALKRIEATCEITRFAEQSMYSYPRGTETVTGPSIRLAEEIIRQWGNCDSGWRILEQDIHQSTVQAFAWDLETNFRKAIEFVVQHVRVTKSKGTYALTDPRDIYELCANQASRRQRNCILAVVPSHVVEAAIGACEKTLSTGGNMDEKRRKLAAAFAEFDVTVDDIERRIAKKLSALTSVDYVQMQKIWKSIKDGMSTKEDWFDAVLDPQKIKRESDAAANETKLPHEKAADAAAKAIAILDFEDACKAYAEKIGTPVIDLIKRDPKDVAKWEVEIVKAATSLLNSALRKVTK